MIKVSWVMIFDDFEDEEEWGTPAEQAVSQSISLLEDMVIRREGATFLNLEGDDLRGQEVYDYDVGEFL